MTLQTMHVDLALKDGRAAHIYLSDMALTISLGPDLVYTLDLSGRLVGAFRQGRNLRRGLDGRVLARWREGRGPRQRLWLDEAARAELLAAFHADLEALWQAGPAQPIKVILDRALRFDYEADVAAYHKVYRPISILPPDQYQALVLQATEGCSFNTCTFCALYRDRPFRIKSPEEFRQHIQGVLQFFGQGIRMRRSIFLADANALIVRQERLAPLFAEVTRVFPIMPEHLPPRQHSTWLKRTDLGMSGIFAFVDGLGAERKSQADFETLRSRGLRRVYIGLESGNEALLAWLQKPSTAAAMLDAVRRMKATRLHVGVIVLTGMGGRRFYDAHCTDTAAILNAMPLEADDIIYFSPFQPDPAAPYASIAAAEGVEPLTEEDARAQEQAIRAALTLPPPPTGPKRVPYNLRDFVY